MVHRTVLKINVLEMEKNITKAAVLFSAPGNLEIVDLELPPLARGQVLVDVHYSGVCRSQLMEVRGLRGHDPWLPHLLGHEAVGNVVSIGESVSKCKSGDPVVLGWITSNGISANPATYKCGEQIINGGQITTFSKLTIVSENKVTKLPRGVDFKHGFLFGCALPTGAGMVINEAKPVVEETILLIGAGGIGASMLAALKGLGIPSEKVFVCDINNVKLEFCKKLGFENIFNLKMDKDIKILKKTIFGNVDLCLESAGSVKTIEFGFDALRSSGRLFFASHPAKGEKIRIDPHELIKGKQIIGSWGGGCHPDIDLPKIASTLSNAKFDYNSLYSKEYSLSEINKALADLEKGHVIRPLINMKQ